MGPSLPRPPDRRRLPRALPRLLVRRLHTARTAAAAARTVRARRAARRARLVHGEERPRRPCRCEPVPADGASRPRRRHPRLYAVAHLRPRTREQRSDAIGHVRGGMGRRRGARADLSPDFGGRTCRRNRCRVRLQHLASDQRRLRAERARRSLALVSQPVREPAHGAVRSPHAGLRRGARHHSAIGLARSPPRSAGVASPAASS